MSSYASDDGTATLLSREIDRGVIPAPTAVPECSAGAVESEHPHEPASMGAGLNVMRRRAGRARFGYQSVSKRPRSRQPLKRCKREWA